MSSYSEGTARDDNIRQFSLEVLGLLALVAAGLLALDTEPRVFSVMAFLSLGGGLTLGAAMVAWSRARLAVVRVPR